MPTGELRRIMDLLDIEAPETAEDLEYQTLEIGGQTIIHVHIPDILLAYIWLLGDPEQLETAMDGILEQAQEERGARKLPECRLVIACVDPDGIEFTAHKRFKESPHSDVACSLSITALAE